MRFLIDAQLPPALARALANEGHQAEHLEDVGMRHAKDSAIWEYARRHQVVIVTKDEDFVSRFRRDVNSPSIVWLRIWNSSTQALLAWFMPLLPIVIIRLQSGDKLVEVR